MTKHNNLLDEPGWSGQVRQKVPGSGNTRIFDVANPDARAALELKSGGTLDTAELLSDEKFIKVENWSVHYVFGKDIDPAALRQLEALKARFSALGLEDKITWEVWHTAPLPRP